jgi:pimeloyl-ACP methyl ester carboxylesterase
MLPWIRAALAALVVLVATPAAPSLAASPTTTVLFVGGYGSTFASAAQSFVPLRAALQSRDANLKFALYSYAGWSGCTPRDYDDVATGQDFELSKQRLLETINALRNACGAGRVVVIGHSLGGLVAFRALSDNPMAEVTDVVTIDSPLGGAPSDEMQTCVDLGFCVDGPVTGVLAGLHGAWDQTARDNGDRVTRLKAAGTRVTAWGNLSDCLYAPTVCLPLARMLLGVEDVGETQWLGIDRTMRLNFTVRQSFASMLISHQVMLSGAAAQIAADLVA